MAVVFCGLLPSLRWPVNDIFTMCPGELSRNKMKPTQQWRERFNRYSKSMPGYYGGVSSLFGFLDIVQLASSALI